MLNTILFPNRPAGKLNTHHVHKIKPPNVVDKSWLIGRNLDLQAMVEELTCMDSKRFIKVYGLAENNKSMIIKSAIKYCMDRNLFKDGFIDVNAAMNFNSLSFKKNLFNQMKLQITKLEDLIDIVHDWQFILMISSCDALLKNSLNDFTKILTQLHTSCPGIHIILNIEDNIDLQLPFDIESIHIKCLQKPDMIRFLKSFDKSNEIFKHISDEELESHELFKNELSNQQIFTIFKLLKSNKSLDEIAKIIYSLN